MGKMQKEKGKRGERELAKILREYGFETRRTQQYAGVTEESADVVGLPYIHIECKRVEKLNIDEALEQAQNDVETLKFPIEEMDKLPAVFHRRNGKPWKVTMCLGYWMELYKEYYSGKELQKRGGTNAQTGV